MKFKEWHGSKSNSRAFQLGYESCKKDVLKILQKDIQNLRYFDPAWRGHMVCEKEYIDLKTIEEIKKL
jgi:hypothetical protein